MNACYAEAKRKPDWTHYDDLPRGSQPMAGETYSSVVERDLLERAFAQLSLDHRSVIVLRYLLDMTPEKVAETLGIPRRTVYSRLKRAMPAMRAALEADARPVSGATASKGVI